MTHKYDPDYVVHPGETVKECMEMYDATPWQIALRRSKELHARENGGNQPDRMRRDAAKLSGEIGEIIFGGRSIEQRHAEAFEQAWNIPKRFWLDRQNAYEQYWRNWMEFMRAYHGLPALPQDNLSTNPDPE